MLLSCLFCFVVGWKFPNVMSMLTPWTCFICWYMSCWSKESLGCGKLQNINSCDLDLDGRHENCHPYRISYNEWTPKTHVLWWVWTMYSIYKHRLQFKSQYNWKNLHNYLERKIRCTLTSHNCCITTPILELESLTRFPIHSNIGNAHNKFTYCS